VDTAQDAQRAARAAPGSRFAAVLPLLHPQQRAQPAAADGAR
jgi:hypothetical protein